MGAAQVRIGDRHFALGMIVPGGIVAGGVAAAAARAFIRHARIEIEHGSGPRLAAEWAMGACLKVGLLHDYPADES